jgi:hypothetical protein
VAWHVRGPRRADLQLRAAAARLPSRRHPLPIPPQLGELRRGAVLLRRQFHLPPRRRPRTAAATAIEDPTYHASFG